MRAHAGQHRLVVVRSPCEAATAGRLLQCRLCGYVAPRLALSRTGVRRSSDRGPVQHQHISCVSRMIWYCARPARTPPRHIPSPTHFLTLASHISAGNSVHSAVGVAGIAGWAPMGTRSSSCTCCSCCFRSRAWKGPLHARRSASGGLGRTFQPLAAPPGFTLSTIHPHQC